MLRANDSSFKCFRDFVDEKCLEALDSMYGEFSCLTNPILSQKTLSEISDMFKSTLSKYYYVISALLNKAKYMNVTRKIDIQAQWDRDILY